MLQVALKIVSRKRVLRWSEVRDVNLLACRLVCESTMHRARALSMFSLNMQLIVHAARGAPAAGPLLGKR